MDVGSLSCGPFQIKERYWDDCGRPGKGKYVVGLVVVVVVVVVLVVVVVVVVVVNGRIKTKVVKGQHRGAEISTPCITWGSRTSVGENPPSPGNSSTDSSNTVVPVCNRVNSV